ncbi:MAG TPA: family 20 glycosylhydrolase [Bacteroidales bacterium]|nr:family 20 glycosylhydrolase [Bacteroidales bacterium]HPT20362.1 family 20 glycosylhydrolase [Bacteroidales bacterium]
MHKAIIFFVSALSLSGLNLFAQNPVLFPAPQKITWGKNMFQVAGAKVLVSADLSSREEKTIDRFIAFVKHSTGVSLPVINNGDSDEQLIVLNSSQPGPALPEINEQTGPGSREAYKIKVTSKRVQINANCDAGVYYALQTLRQLIIVKDNNCYIPEVDIDDYPAFAYRGVMMDFSHGGLLTEEEIKNQIDFLARWKLNQYYFYNEVSIEMKGYPLLNYNACYSQEQIRRIVAYGLERHVDVIPFVNFYGHLHELLRLEKYASLGIGQYGHELDPGNQAVQTVLKEWIKQYSEIFPSPFIHVGFDETWETERLHKTDYSINPRELYLRQLNFVTSTLRGYGKKVMIWTDITRNYPDIMSDFPRDLIPVIWEYSDQPGSVSKWLKPVSKEKMPFFVQSAVDNWGNVYTAADYTFDNIDICLKACRDEKAIGYITSVWTDAVQPLMRNSWLFMAYGTAGAWQREPLKRDEFINGFCQIMYPGISVQMNNAFRKMAESEASLAKCLGLHTLLEMWSDPFSSYHLKNTKDHIDDYKNARKAAEAAQENLLEALLSQPDDSAFIKTLLVNSRLLDYTASRFIWARTIVDRWNWDYDCNSNEKDDFSKIYDTNYSTHGLTVDMMDYCTQIKEEYIKAWISENMKYRLGTITGRFDSEYLLWRNIYTRIADFQLHNKINSQTNRFEDVILK